MTTSAANKNNDAHAVETPTPVCDFLDLRAQFASIRDEVMAAITRVMESQQFVLGPEVTHFEEEIAAYLGAKHAVGCASGTDALILALMAAGISRGDEVITTPFSFVATAGSIAWVGAKPVFVDIDPVTFNIDSAKIEAAITPRTKAIMPVHLFGLPAELGPIAAIAGAHKLAVIEDAAQAIGAKYDGRFTGTIGDLGCFSFFPSKNLGAAGEGGLITTNDSDMAERLRMLRIHGSRTKYIHERLGTNSRLHAVQAAILRVKLRHLEKWAEGRANRAARYRHLFEKRGLTGVVTCPPVPDTTFRHVYNQFTIRAQRRDELKESLRKTGIPSEIYYPKCLHLQMAFADLGYKPGSMPIAESISEQVLSLPVFPELTDTQQDAIVEGIAQFYGEI